jgi:hypothetical protein
VSGAIMSENSKKKYEVALSFAGEDRELAEALASKLVMDRGIAVFYDKYEKASLWGKDLYTYLADLYQNQAEYCVMLLSKHYAEKLWTNHERKAAQTRAFQENKEYILPIRLDDTEIPGILSTIGYLNWQEETVDTIANAIVAKLQLQSPAPRTGSLLRNKPIIKSPISWDELQPLHFESFDEVDADTDDLETLKEKLNEVWLPYQEEIWSATISDGVYKLTNKTEVTAVKYKYLRIDNNDMAEYPVSVEIKTDLAMGTFLSGGGLIYRYDRESKDYYVFSLSKGDKFSFYIRQGGVYTPLYSGRSEYIQPDKFNKLAIFSKEFTFSLFINDHLVKTIRDSAFSTGDIGIVAMGMGEFFFDNLTVYELVPK